MRKFMNNDASFEIAVPVGDGGVPEIHTATTVLTIGWLCKGMSGGDIVRVYDVLTVMKFA
jgi:hypothetical protein